MKNKIQRLAHGLNPALILTIALILNGMVVSPLFPQHRTRVKVLYAETPAARAAIEQNTSRILTEFNRASHNKTKPVLGSDCVSENAKQRILALWDTNPFECSEAKLELAVVYMPDKTIELRGIPFRMNLSKDTVHTEEGVFILKENGKIEDMYFGLPAHQYRKLLGAGSDVTDFRRRQVILDFVENFRTAYNRKDISYINDVFSDNALIIVGQVIKQEPNSAGYLEKNLGEVKVKLIRQSKQKYIENLTACFKNNKFIKVGFDNIRIIQHKLCPYIYGVPLEQSWVSSNYSDQGYLFLMVSFREESKPLILVRAWQPKEYTQPDSVISLGDFIVNPTIN